MTPALKSRLSAERLFTAEQLADAHFWGAYHGATLAHLEPSKARDWASARRAEFLGDALEEVRAHLTSDTTTIRPLGWHKGGPTIGYTYEEPGQPEPKDKR